MKSPLFSATIRARNFRHGFTERGKKRPPEYHAWATAIKRCTNQRCAKYHRYGGRGIRVCEQWRRDFAAFYAYIGPKPSPHHVLDRIDNDGHYEPGNVRWVTQSQSMRNTSRTRMVTINGVTKCVSDWADTLGIARDTFRDRLKRGIAGVVHSGQELTELVGG